MRGPYTVAEEVVLQRLLHAFAHGLEAREMDHGADGLAREGFPKLREIGAVDGVERRPDAGDPLNLVDDPGLGVGKIVHDDHVMARLLQFHHRMAADIARAARYQYVHSFSS